MPPPQENRHAPHGNFWDKSSQQISLRAIMPLCEWFCPFTQLLSQKLCNKTNDSFSLPPTTFVCFTRGKTMQSIPKVVGQYARHGQNQAAQQHQKSTFLNSKLGDAFSCCRYQLFILLIKESSHFSNQRLVKVCFLPQLLGQKLWEVCETQQILATLRVATFGTKVAKKISNFVCFVMLRRLRALFPGGIRSQYVKQNITPFVPKGANAPPQVTTFAKQKL